MPSWFLSKTVKASLNVASSYKKRLSILENHLESWSHVRDQQGIDYILNKWGLSLTSEVSDSKIFFRSASLKAVIWKYAIPINFFSRPLWTFLLVSFSLPKWTFPFVSFSLLIWTSPFFYFSLLIWTFLFAELTLRKSGELSNRPGVLPTQYISERGTFSKF